jgi:heme/copper-type cytochrome/quinol oxidase subunit 2
MSLIKSFLTLAFIMAAQSLLACPACVGGKTDAEMAQGMNAGIFSLLGVIVAVLIGVASVGFYLVRRASRMSQFTGPEPVAQPTI